MKTISVKPHHLIAHAVYIIPRFLTEIRINKIEDIFQCVKVVSPKEHGRDTRMLPINLLISLLGLHFGSEDGGSTFPRNINTLLPHYITSHSRR
jgi:hypothetical protein